MNRAAERALDAAYAAGWAALRHAPERALRPPFDLAAAAVARRDGAGVRRLTANLRRVLGPDVDEAALAATVRAGMRSYLRYWREVFRLPSLDRDEVVGRMQVTDEPLLRQARAEGRGMILALPHTGNWDHAGAWLVATGVPFTTVAERLEPAALFDRFVAFRSSLGMEVLALTGGERPPYAVLAERLRAGGCLCLLADRDLTSSGVQVDFFGAPARMPSGPARLAIETGAALLPVTLWYPPGGGWAGRVHPRVLPPAGADRAGQVAAMTQALADAFAGSIAAHPADWHMLQRVWVADLDPARLAAPAAVAG